MYGAKLIGVSNQLTVSACLIRACFGNDAMYSKNHLHLIFLNYSPEVSLGGSFLPYYSPYIIDGHSVFVK